MYVLESRGKCAINDILLRICSPHSIETKCITNISKYCQNFNRVDLFLNCYIFIFGYNISVQRSWSKLYIRLWFYCILSNEKLWNPAIFDLAEMNHFLLVYEKEIKKKNFLESTYSWAIKYIFRLIKSYLKQYQKIDSVKLYFYMKI